MLKEQINGKSLVELITKNTAIHGTDLKEVTERCKDNTLCVTNEWQINREDPYTIVAEYDNDWVLVFKHEELMALWPVYELHDVVYNKKRGFIRSTGHETIEEYWLNDGEFTLTYTR